jgi:hypothetical protein
LSVASARDIAARMSFEDVANRMRSRHQPFEAPDDIDRQRMLLPSGLPDDVHYRLALEDFKDRQRRAIVGGLLLFGVGAAITLLTQSAAEASGGGTYIIAYGPIVWGIIYLLKGLLATPPKRP